LQYSVSTSDCFLHQAIKVHVEKSNNTRTYKPAKDINENEED